MTCSRAKGKRGELEARDALRDALGCRDAKRGQQRSGLECADVVDALAGVHLEVKRRRSIAAVRFIEQAERDARPGELPVVLMRQDRDRGWLLMLRLTEARRFAEAVLAIEQDAPVRARATPDSGVLSGGSASAHGVTVTETPNGDTLSGDSGDGDGLRAREGGTP